MIPVTPYATLHRMPKFHGCGHILRVVVELYAAAPEDAKVEIRCGEFSQALVDGEPVSHRLCLETA